ncbi:MAG: histidine kinase [Deltaproteobacteria bacterium]|nr:histidine kinase [Deltaproteobacteria bacterium]
MDVVQLLGLLFQRFGLIVVGCFILMQVKPFRRVVTARTTTIERLVIAGVFGLFGIVGNYALYWSPVDAYPNLRAMAVITAGILGGPLVGLGAGLIAGLYRLFLGGFSVIPCALATITEGAMAGAAIHYFKLDRLDWRTGFFVCACGEMYHMLLVLVLSKPFAQAFILVKLIIFPMVLVNSIGTSIIIAIIKLILKSEEKIGAVQAQKALHIATQTVGYLRTGLNDVSASKTVDIIYKMMNYAAVAITDRTRTLAYRGMGADHHRVGDPHLTMSTQEVIRSGRHKILRKRSEIGCSFLECPLASGIIMPLTKQKELLGTLKFFRAEPNNISKLDIEMAVGLSKLFSIQLELEEIQQQSRLVDKAEIKALQAQINPHFLFNSLNTIVSFIRTDSEKARELLVHLGAFFRATLRNGKGDFVTLDKELENIMSYLRIEEARFGDRIAIRYSLNHTDEQWHLPHLTLQPLVENAIRHGLAPKEGGGVVKIATAEENGILEVSIEDDGIGMSPETVKKIFQGDDGRSEGLGIALKNIDRRLRYLYGAGCGIVIESACGKGTKVSVRIPRSDFHETAA